MTYFVNIDEEVRVTVEVELTFERSSNDDNQGCWKITGLFVNGIDLDTDGYYDTDDVEKIIGCPVEEA